MVIDLKKSTDDLFFSALSSCVLNRHDHKMGAIAKTEKIGNRSFLLSEHKKEVMTQKIITFQDDFLFVSRFRLRKRKVEDFQKSKN